MHYTTYSLYHVMFYLTFCLHWMCLNKSVMEMSYYRHCVKCLYCNNELEYKQKGWFKEKSWVKFKCLYTYFFLFHFLKYFNSFHSSSRSHWANHFANFCMIFNMKLWLFLWHEMFVLLPMHLSKINYWRKMDLNMMTFFFIHIHTFYFTFI